MNSSQFKVIAFGFLLVIGVIGFFSTVEIVKANGNEAIVAQSMTSGVVSEVKLSGTHTYIPGFFYDTYKYNIGTQKFTFDSSESNADAEGGSIEAAVGEGGGQKVWVAGSINYRLGWVATDKGPVFSSAKLVELHKDGIGRTYESVILKRTIVDVINQIARPKDALSIYSGQGFVDFKEEVDRALKNHPLFRDRGIYIENTIIYKVSLDPAYEKEIATKQLAIQTKLRKIEETKAAEEEAKRVFAEANAEVQKRTQQAEANKVEQVKKAEAENQRVILSAEAEKAKSVLQAEAEKQKLILEAEGQRDANLAAAAGILAKGEAEAKVEELKRDAKYDGQSGARRAQVEIAAFQAEKLKGVLDGVKVISDKTLLQITNDTDSMKVTVPANE